MATLVWDGSTLTWDGEDIDWSESYAADPAPPWPDDLYGDAAPRMLGFLPPLYERSTYVRALLQAEGYELDLARSFSDDLPSCARPDDCPEWAIPAWEVAYSIESNESWTAEERRAAIVAANSPVRTVAEFTDYLAAFTREDPADITVVQVGYELQVTFASALSTTELAAARQAARRVLPAHLTLDLTGA